MIPVRETALGVSFAVRVHPRARKTAITGVFGEGEGGALKLALNAPPVDGKANEALVRFFAELFRVQQSKVHIASGEKSRTKVIRVSGLSIAAVLEALRENLRG